MQEDPEQIPGEPGLAPHDAPPSAGAPPGTRNIEGHQGQPGGRTFGIRNIEGHVVRLFKKLRRRKT